MTVGLRSASLALVVLLAGCAYYNGLYNANRLADEARRAEREGRTGEARSLWARAAVKAESVATRYPGSRYRDDALLLWGRGFAQAGDCRRAVPPLAMAVDSSTDAALTQDARLLLADCRLRLRQPVEAILAIEPLLAASDSGLVLEALHRRGSARLAAGEPEQAVADLERVPVQDGGLDLARAYSQVGELDRAAQTLAERASGSYEEAEWRAVLDEVGTRGPEHAARVVDQLTARHDLTSGQRARLLIDDAERRWARGNLSAAVERYGQAEAIASDSTEGAVARAYLAVAALRTLGDLRELPGVERQLRAAVGSAGPAASAAQLALRLVQSAQTVVADPRREGRGLGFFVIGEILRDSLRAPHPATLFFLEAAVQDPDSRFAPKALLAAAMLAPEQADSIRSVLEARYPFSPYTLVLAGEGGSEFAALEDSLRVLLQLERQRLAIGRSAEEGREEIRRERRPDR